MPRWRSGGRSTTAALTGWGRGSWHTGAAEGPLLETRSSWEVLEVFSPNSTPTPPQGPRGCTARGHAAGAELSQGLHACPPYAPPPGKPGSPGRCGWPPARAPHTDLGPQPVTVRPTGAGVCSPTPALYTPQRALERWEGPQVGRWEPCLQAQTQRGDKAQCAGRTTRDASSPASTTLCPWERRPDYPTGPGGPARERRPRAHPSGHHVPKCLAEQPPAQAAEPSTR